MSFLVALLLVSTDAVAQPQPVAPVPAVAAVPKKAKEKKICKADEADPGSHMAKRICHTEDEWNHQGLLESSRSGFTISGAKDH